MKPRDRDRRRRGFDDDFFGSSGGGGGYPPSPQVRASGPPRPRAPVASGPVTEGTVKWFNTEKGFGFVAMSDGTGDAFLHAAVLASTGTQTVAPGTKLKLRTGMGQKGAQVTEVLEIDASTAVEESIGGGGGGSAGNRRFEAAPRARRAAPDLADAIEMTGTVKWYNPDKGFGFVAVGDGGKDVFIHASALERSGIRNLNEGQAVRLMVVEGMKGREAASVHEA